MKKCFLLMAGIILLVFAACQSDELANGGRNGTLPPLSVYSCLGTGTML